MNLSFNELSFLPLINDNQNLINQFDVLINTFKDVKENNGFSHIIFPSDLSILEATSTMSFSEWIYSLPIKEKTKILTFTSRKPFIDNILSEQIKELDSYYFENLELGIEQNYCNGLSTAHILEIPAISLANNIFWQNIKIDFFKENSSTNKTDTVDVFNISTSQSINDISFQNHLTSITQVILSKSVLEPHQKPIHFRDDHGSDVLMKFAKSLVNSEYINGVINSIPFNPKSNRLIKKISSDGKIDLVLYWEDAGYGMVIQTTGRNFRETKAIAEIIKDNFDR